MTLADLLDLPILHGARVVAGDDGLCHEVEWVHVVDLPDPLVWVRRGHLLLTTGIAWPREPEAERCRVRGLARHGLTGLAMAVPQFFDRFSDAARAEANAVGLPLLEIPWEVPFADITQDAHRAILAQQYRTLAKSETVHRELTRTAVEAVSLQELADTLGGLLARPVAFEGADGAVLASFDPAPDAQRRSTAVDAEVLRLLESRGLLRAVRPDGGSVRVPAVPDLGLCPRLVCPIRIRGEAAGMVWVLEGDTALSEVDMRAAEHAAVVAAVHIAHQRQLASVEARLGYAFLDALLEGSFEPTARNLERARLAGFDAGGRYRVAILALDEAVPLSRDGLLRREAVAERLEARLVDLSGVGLLSPALNRISMLIPCQLGPEQLWRGFESEGSLGVGSCRRGPEGVRPSRDDAMAALRFAERPGLHRYEDFVVPRLLGGDPAARDQFLGDLFDGLEAVRGADALKLTLLRWAAVGFRQRRAAEELGIHVNTLRYRLDRAAELAGLDLKDVELRFHLQLAARLLGSSHKDDRLGL